MKKKNILLLALALCASISLASCDDKGQNTYHYRGEVDTSDSNVTIPDVLTPKNNEGQQNPKPIPSPDGGDQVEADDTIDFSEGSNIETQAGSGYSEQLEDGEILYVTTNIGYDFLGWYIGSTQVSTNTFYRASAEESGLVTAKFKVNDDFKYIEFTSNQVECVVTGLKPGYPGDLVIPEGVTKITENALFEANVAILTLPSTLTEIEYHALYCSYIYQLNLKAVPTIIGEDVAEYSNVCEIFVPANTDSSYIESAFAHDSYIIDVLNENDDSSFIYKDGFMFSYWQGEWTLVKYYGNEKDIVLPSDSDLISAYYVGEDAFMNNSNIETVVFSDTSIYIEQYAFKGCENLREVTLTNNVLSLGYCAFYYCTSLEKVVIGSGIEYISDQAFMDCYALNDVTLGENLERIGEQVFYDCSSLREIVIPEKVNCIDDKAFYNCNSLLTVYNYSDLNITAGSSDYGYVAYYANEVLAKGEQSQLVLLDNFLYDKDDDNKVITLTKYLGYDSNVVIPSYQDYDIVLGSDLFYNNYNLETVIFNEYVKEVGSETFENCSNLKSVDLMNCKYIKQYAFSGCDSIESIIADKCETVYNQSIMNCDKLKTVSLKECLTIGQSAFNSCSALEEIDAPKVTSLGAYAFAYCTKLKSISFPLVTSIPEQLCYQCYCLESMNFPAITSIGESAFKFCYNLSEITLPEGLTTIKRYAFSDCYSLYKVTLPSTLSFTTSSSSSTGYYTYGDQFYYCFNLVEVVNNTTANLTAGVGGYGGVCSYSKNVINSTNTESILKNDNGLISYFDTSDSKRHLVHVSDKSATKTVIPDDIEVINKHVLYNLESEELVINGLFNASSSYNYLGYAYGADSYYNSYNYIPKTLKKITIGDNVPYLDNHAFYSCNLDSLTFGANTSSINNAFESCQIKEVYYEGTVEDWCDISFSSLGSNPTSVGAKVYFKNNDTYSELTSITIPDSTKIGIAQFAYFNLEEVTLPENVTTIYNYAFYGCKNLTTINLDKVESIGDYAFNSCKLSAVTFNSELSSLGDYAFANNSYIKSVVIPSTVSTISDYAFSNCINLLSVKLVETIITDENDDVVSVEGATSIGKCSFENCRSLYTLIIPRTLSTIGEGAFKNCENLEEVDLSETTVSSIPEYAFYYCKSLETIEFSQNLESIGTTTFEGCDKLNYTVYGNGCYFGTADNPYKWLVKARAKTIIDVSVHPDCVKIYGGAFKSCTYLKRVVIPATCTDIERCLNGLTNVEYIELPYVSENVFGQAIFGVANSNVSSKLKTVIINGGTTIPTSAFEGISTITKIEITGDITTIGESAFKDCKNANIILPATITRIEASAFENSGIREFEVKTTSMNSLGNDAFKNCVHLVSANLYKLDSTSNYYTKNNYSTGTFYGCTSLETVVLPNGSVCINTRMFYGCTSLESISIPDTVDQINPYAFMNSGIKTITWPTTRIVILKLFKGAFSNTQITTLTLPNNLLIQDGDDSYSYQHPENPICGVFEGCVNLTSVDIRYDMGKNGESSTYKYTGKYAFKGCTNLESVNYLATGSKVSENTYENCSKLKTVNFQKITAIDKYAFMNTALESITFASGVVLKENAFCNCTELEEITFNGSFSFTTQYTTIEQVTSAFYGCTSLTTVNLATSRAIPNFMFMDCESLNTVNFDNVTSIGNYAFMNCGFTSITLPSTITSVGIEAFKGCKKLTTLDIQCDLDKSTCEIFSECTALTDVTLGENLTSISDGLFSGCTSLRSLIIPDNITSIESRSLQSCGFVNLTIPASVTSIGFLSIINNKQLEKVIFKGDFTGDHEILSDCPNLKEVVFEGNLTAICDQMFENDAKLSIITIPASVTSIGGAAFSGCTSLKSINIPEGVTTIGETAFKNCRLISTITLPASLESIGTDAFDGCYSLIEVYNLSTLTVIAGSEDNGKVALYAKAIHTSADEPSAIITDANGYRFMYDGEKGYLIGYTGDSYCLDLPNSFTYNETTINSYEIAEKAFYQNKDIYSIKIPASVTAIGTDAFNECCHLVEIYNASLLDLGTGYTGNGYVAYYAIKIHEDYTEDSILVFDESGYVFTIGTESCVIGYTKNDTDLVIPGSFTHNGVIYTDLKINGYAFAYSNITSVKILDGVKKLGRYTFGYCYSLKHVEIADTVVNDEFHPFYYCNRVETYKGPARYAAYVGDPYNYFEYSYKDYSHNNYLTTVIITSGSSIDSYAFCKNSSLKTIVIPVSVTDIGYQSGYTFYKVTLEKIFYEGTKEQFYKIKGLYASGNDTAISNATKYFYSEEAPTDTDNNYWHYVNGEITIWTTE